MSQLVKVVLVTGGSSGLGNAMCMRLTAEGHKVYGTGRKVISGSLRGGVTLIAMDLTDEASVQAATAEVLRREGRIDVVINNAGVGIEGPAEDITPALAMQLLDTNVLGAHRVCRAVLPGMRQQKSGLIINISSVAANFGLPYRSFYSASKAALERYGEALAIEVARFGIHVVNVEPGEFKTNIAGSRLKPGSFTPDNRPGYERAMEILSSSLHYSRDPDELALVIARIVGAKRPKARYLVATGIQRLSVLAKKFMPGRMFQRMVGKHYE